MRSYALALGLGTALLALAPGCTVENDYAVAVSWTINGYAPNASLCADQGIARGRFEVRDRRGNTIKTLEADCASEVTLELGDPPQLAVFGGFETNYAFDWDTTYKFSVTLVDASGNARGAAYEGEFEVGYDEGEILQLETYDYLQPSGTAAALTAEWSVRNRDDVAAACAQADIATVRLLLASGQDEDFQSNDTAAFANANVVEIGKASCGARTFVSPGKILAVGAYMVRYEALSSAGARVALGAPIPVTVDGSQETIALRREMFLN